MKYSAISLLVLAAGILVLAWSLAGPGKGLNSTRSGSAELAELTRQISVPPRRIEALREAGRKTERLRAVQPARIAAEIPVLIETRPVTAALVAAEEGDKEESEPRRETPRREYHLSMVFVGPEKKYAVIDGVFRQEGERIPGDAEVVAIHKGLVELRERRGALRVLRMNEPQKSAGSPSAQK